MKRTSVLCLLAVLLVASMASASIRFHGSGSWDMLEGVGQPEGWQSAVAPGTEDTVRANWGGDTGNVVTLNYATTIKNFELGVGESGEFHILSGGHLTTLNDSRIGNNGDTAARKGTLTIDAGGQVTINSWLGIGHGTTGIATVSGTLTTTSHLWMGGTSDADSNGSLTINNGGIVNVAGNIGLGTINAGTPSGGVAVINVNDGGLLNLHQWSGATSIQDGSVMNINGTGTVIIGGNRVNEADAYFALGKIASDLGAIQSVYDETGEFTTITAVPEPATMILLGLGGMLIRKRR